MPKETKWPRNKGTDVINFLMKTLKGHKKWEVCGSYRRGLPFIRDLDIVVTPSDEHKLMESIHFMAKEVLVSGNKTIRIKVFNGMQVDFMIVHPDSFDSAVLHSSGSKGFNIKCRIAAKSIGLKLNQYGLFNDGIKVASTERSILETIKMEKFLDPRTRNL